jgi:hypothetical protein
MTWRLILLTELQQATSRSFIIPMSCRLCLQSRQVMSFQERKKKLVWRELWSLFLYQ